jgi:hypothetical protein
VLVPFCASRHSRQCADRGPSRVQAQSASGWDPKGRTCGSGGGRRSSPCGRGRVPASSALPCARPLGSHAAVATAAAAAGGRGFACWGASSGLAGSGPTGLTALCTCTGTRVACRAVGRLPGSHMSPIDARGPAAVVCWTCREGQVSACRRYVARRRSGRRGRLALGPQGVQPTRDCLNSRCRPARYHPLWSYRHQCQGCLGLEGRRKWHRNCW